MSGHGGEKGLKAPADVPAGTPIPVQVQVEGATEIVATGSDGVSTPIPVGPDGTASVPTNPAWPPGSTVTITLRDSPFASVVVEIAPPGD